MTQSLVTHPQPSLRDLIVIDARARGETATKAATKAGVSRATGTRIIARFRDLLEETKAKIGTRFLNQYEPVYEAMLATATNTDSRLQVAAFKELNEKLLGWGLKQGDTHIGEVNVTIDTIDARSITITPELQAEMDRRKADLGF